MSSSKLTNYGLLRTLLTTTIKLLQNAIIINTIATYNKLIDLSSPLIRTINKINPRIENKIAMYNRYYK